MADEQPVRFTRKSAERISKAVQAFEHGTQPLADAKRVEQHPPRQRRVKLREDLADDNFVSGILQIQKEDGNIEWADTETIIPNIYKGHPDQPDFSEDDIVWVTLFRGRWYVLHTDGLILMQSVHDAPLGPRDTGGIEIVGDAKKVTDWDLGTLATDEVEVDFRYLNAVVFPGQTFYAIQKQGVYWAESGGTATIRGTAVDDFAGGFGDITVDQTGLQYDIEVIDLCGRIILADSVVLAHFTYDDDAWQFFVSNSCCPPSGA